MTEPNSTNDVVAHAQLAAHGLGPSIADVGLKVESPTAAALPPTNTKSAAAPGTESQLPTSWLWLRDHDQSFIAVCVTIFLVLVGYHWATLSGWGAVPLEVDRLPARRYDFRIDINKSSWVEWTQIEGIGEATANKIVSDREANGPFRNINDLLRVKGIGPKTLEKMRPFLRDGSEQNRSNPADR